MTKMKVLHPIELRYDAMSILHEGNILTITLSNKKKPIVQYTYDDFRIGDCANLTGLTGHVELKIETKS